MPQIFSHLQLSTEDSITTLDHKNSTQVNIFNDKLSTEDSTTTLDQKLPHK